MENFNILGVHLKILLLEGGSQKNNIKGGGGGGGGRGVGQFAH